jgi:hypothetical protein
LTQCIEVVTRAARSATAFPPRIKVFAAPGVVRSGLIALSVYSGIGVGPSDARFIDGKLGRAAASTRSADKLCGPALGERAVDRPYSDRVNKSPRERRVAVAPTPAQNNEAASWAASRVYSRRGALNPALR